MEKYIGNKKTILNEIFKFVKKKKIEDGLLIDAFAGTTNVSQFFKQKGFSILCNDINSLSYVLGKAYICNNSFPNYDKVLKNIQNKGFVLDLDYVKQTLNYIKKKIKSDIIYPKDYYEKEEFETNIIPYISVLCYLNNLELSDNEICNLFFDYYTSEGAKSEFVSTRGTKGNRNYFSSYNAKKLGVVLNEIRNWYNDNIISENELYILLASVIEEVTLVANVNGTFHDFNRKKLYPNAIVDIQFKPIVLNIFHGNSKYISSKMDANELKTSVEISNIDISNSILYIDPPYNFRQYSSYYHMLNFIADYVFIENLLDFAAGFEYVRGQNMSKNFNSQYCYKDTFVDSLKDLIDGLKTKSVIISYYDENNHWNHGKKEISMQGRTEILNIFNKLPDIAYFDKEPYTIPRKNYQSQSGEHKKTIDELLFFARR